MTTPLVAVVGASQTQSDHPDYEAGIRLGNQLAEAGCAVVTGGYGGLMEAVSAGAAGAGGRVVGVTAPTVFPGRRGANRHVTEEWQAATITERIHDLLSSTDAVIALPGSIGTFAELIMAWNLASVAPFSGQRPKPIVAVGSEWTELVPMLAERLKISGDLVTFAATPEEAGRVVIERLGASPTF